LREVHRRAWCLLGPIAPRAGPPRGPRLQPRKTKKRAPLVRPRACPHGPRKPSPPQPSGRAHPPSTPKRAGRGRSRGRPAETMPRAGFVRHALLCGPRGARADPEAHHGVSRRATAFAQSPELRPVRRLFPPWSLPISCGNHPPPTGRALVLPWASRRLPPVSIAQDVLNRLLIQGTRRLGLKVRGPPSRPAEPVPCSGARGGEGLLPRPWPEAGFFLVAIRKSCRPWVVGRRAPALGRASP